MTEATTRIPDRRAVALCSVLAGGAGAVYWILSFLLRPGDPFSTLVMYRHGDCDYLPQIYGLAELAWRELMHYESLGSSILFFPMAGAFPHAVALAVLGNVGFVVADVALSMARYLACYLIVARVVRNRSRAALGAIVVFFLAGPGWSGAWDYRLTRPYVTGVFLAGAVAALIHVAQSVNDRRCGRWPFLALGALLGALVQSDVHGAEGLLIATALVALGSAWRRRRIDPGWTWTGLALLVVVVPFLVQYAQAAPEVVRRWGQFPVSRLPPPWLPLVRSQIAIVPVGVAWAAARWAPETLRRLAPPGARTALATWMAILVGAYLALPVNVILRGSAIQTYHYLDRGRVLGYLALYTALAFLGGLAGQWAAERWRWGTIGRGPRILAAAAGLTLVAGLAAPLIPLHLSRVRAESQQRVWTGRGFDAIPNYRRSFVALATELRQPRYASSAVLGTFDFSLATWWVAFRGGQLYIPDPFLSTVPDQLIEDRMIAFSHLVAMDAEQFSRHLDEDYFLARFHSLAKYQASAAFTYADLTDYLPRDQERIRESTFFQSWQLAVPRSERRRLRESFSRPRSLAGRLDLVILVRSKDFPGLTVVHPGFVKTWENDVFQVWQQVGRG